MFWRFIRKLQTMLGDVIESLRDKNSPKSDRNFYRFLDTVDFPDAVKEKYVYVVGEKNNKWVAVLKCPCGCNDTIQLNLLEDSKPSWRIVLHKKKKRSISPSVNRIVNCKSHFNIVKGGRIKWWGQR